MEPKTETKHSGELRAVLLNAALDHKAGSGLLPAGVATALSHCSLPKRKWSKKWNEKVRLPQYDLYIQLFCCMSLRQIKPDQRHRAGRVRWV